MVEHTSLRLVTDGKKWAVKGKEVTAYGEETILIGKTGDLWSRAANMLQHGWMEKEEAEQLFVRFQIMLSPPMKVTGKRWWKFW